MEKGYLTAGSTGRCITGIRQQFSTPTSIKIAMESVRLFRAMNEEFDLDVEWKDSGYLFLSHAQESSDMFQNNIKIQKEFGLDVSYITADECKKIVPLLNIEDLIGGAYCPSDGQANPFLIVLGYAEGIKKKEGMIKNGTKVVSIGVEKNKVQSVTTDTGDTYWAPIILNAAGPWAKEIGKMAGVKLDVEPDRHAALITEGVQYKGFPMLVDYRPDGGYFVQRVTGQFIGCYTPEEKIPGFVVDSTLDFMAEMARRMCRLVPALENVAILRQWAGSYCMTPDGNPIVDKTNVEGYYCSVGMCGHGFMLAPALSKYLAQYVTENTWPIDMDEFAFGRTFGEREKMR